MKSLENSIKTFFLLQWINKSDLNVQICNDKFYKTVDNFDFKYI